MNPKIPAPDTRSSLSPDQPAEHRTTADGATGTGPAGQHAPAGAFTNQRLARSASLGALSSDRRSGPSGFQRRSSLPGASNSTDAVQDAAPDEAARARDACVAAHHPPGFTAGPDALLEPMDDIFARMGNGTLSTVDGALALSAVLQQTLQAASPPDASVAARPVNPSVERVQVILADILGQHEAQAGGSSRADATDLTRRILDFLESDAPAAEPMHAAPEANAPDAIQQEPRETSEDLVIRARRMIADTQAQQQAAPATVEQKTSAISLVVLESMFAPLASALQAVGRNEFEGKAATVAATVANAAARNGISVGLPAILRGLISYGVQAGLDRNKVGDEARATMAAVVMLLPVLLIAGGAARDLRAGSAKWTSLLAQAIMVCQTVAFAVAGLKTKTIGSTMAPFSAFTAFGAMRTVGVQSRLTLTDPHSDGAPLDAIDYAAASTIYGLGVFLSTFAYSTRALRTGAASFKARDSVGGAAQGAGLAALNNIWQELNDALGSPGVPAARERRTLALQFGDRGYQTTHVVNQVLGGYPMLTVYNTACIMAGSIAASYFPADPLKSNLVLAAVYAVYSGVFYTPFGVALSGQPMPVSADAEAIELEHVAHPVESGPGGAIRLQTSDQGSTTDSHTHTHREVALRASHSSHGGNSAQEGGSRDRGNP